MKIFAISKTAGVDFAALRPHLEDEARAVWRLYREGCVREFYLRSDGPGVVFAFEATTAEEVRSRLNELPLVQKGIIQFDVIPVGPLLSFELLMDELAGSAAAH